MQCELYDYRASEYLGFSDAGIQNHCASILLNLKSNSL